MSVDTATLEVEVDFPLTCCAFGLLGDSGILIEKASKACPSKQRLFS